MKPDWRETFSRLLDGADLDASEARTLSEALSDPAQRIEAGDWLRFEASLRSCLSQRDEGRIALARERLLAESLLREKSWHVKSAQRRRSLLFWPMAAAAAVLAVILAGWLWERRYPAPRCEGQFGVVRGGEAIGQAALVRREDRLKVGPKGMVLELGGYCRLDYDGGAETVLAGQPGEEAVELVRGRVRSRVDPQRGRFQVLTIQGVIEVKGTEFVTTVDDLGLVTGGEEMTLEKRKLSTLVTVVVLSGSVVCHFGPNVFTLGPGQDCVYAEEEGGNKARGVVVSVEEGVLKLKSGDKTATLRASPENKLARQEVSQLNPGDVVTVTWVSREGEKWVTDVSGKGTLVGTVTRIEEHNITVTPEGGKPQQFRPPWIGGMPADGGGPDKGVLAKIRKQKVGSKVKLTWDLVEGKRVVDIEGVE